MKKYEVMYIIRSEVEEEQRKALIQELNDLFQQAAAQVLKTTEWGMRDLAYEIDGTRKGYYVLLNVEANPEAIQEFNRVANIKEQIIRFIVVTQ